MFSYRRYVIHQNYYLSHQTGERLSDLPKCLSGKIRSLNQKLQNRKTVSQKNTQLF
jgi:hypothetical protein